LEELVRLLGVVGVLVDRDDERLTVREESSDDAGPSILVAEWVGPGTGDLKSSTHAGRYRHLR
jgi:hypothetical protein